MVDSAFLVDTEESGDIWIGPLVDASEAAWNLVEELSGAKEAPTGRWKAVDSILICVKRLRRTCVRQPHDHGPRPERFLQTNTIQNGEGDILSGCLPTLRKRKVHLSGPIRVIKKFGEFFQEDVVPEMLLNFEKSFTEFARMQFRPWRLITA